MARDGVSGRETKIRFGSDQSDIQPLPYKVVDDGSGKPIIRVIYRGEQRLFTVEEILSKVVIKLKEIAEAYLNGARVKNAVIAVPAYLDYSQCQAIKGPTAAALAYRLDKKVTKSNVLIFHLGGATFDAPLLTIDEQGSIEVKARPGQGYLGGKNVDKSLIKFCVDKFNKNHGKDYWSLRFEASLVDKISSSWL
ncbi:hypothetical protein L1049_011219 [Liquidambar formosana]|uniref:Heat shock protein 70 n=1 Tax=Liquidambar formosana TaxID=63359 RepID=A0AAP0RV62_LIQFO